MHGVPYNEGRRPTDRHTVILRFTTWLFFLRVTLNHRGVKDGTTRLRARFRSQSSGYTNVVADQSGDGPAERRLVDGQFDFVVRRRRRRRRRSDCLCRASYEHPGRVNNVSAFHAGLAPAAGPDNLPLRLSSRKSRSRRRTNERNAGVETRGPDGLRRARRKRSETDRRNR